MRRTYGNTRHERFGMRVIEIFQLKDRYEVELMSTLRALHLADALKKFQEDYLEKLGYTSPLRTGNIIGAYDREGKYQEFLARDKPLAF